MAPTTPPSTSWASSGLSGLLLPSCPFPNTADATRLMVGSQPVAWGHETPVGMRAPAPTGRVSGRASCPFVNCTPFQPAELPPQIERQRSPELVRAGPWARPANLSRSGISPLTQRMPPKSLPFLPGPRHVLAQLPRRAPLLRRVGPWPVLAGPWLRLIYRQGLCW